MRITLNEFQRMIRWKCIDIRKLNIHLIISNSWIVYFLKVRFILSFELNFCWNFMAYVLTQDSEDTLEVTTYTYIKCGKIASKPINKSASI